MSKGSSTNVQIFPRRSTQSAPIHFDFWGAPVAVFVDHEEDRAHLKYYFRDYVASPAEGIALWMESPSAPFTSDRRDDQAVWLSRNGSEPLLHTRPSSGSQPPTVLPPFGLTPLKHKVRTIHASAASPAVAPDHALVIHGESLTGKSSVLLELLRRGWGFITDDTVVLEGTGILSYTRPIGIREETLARNQWISPNLGRAKSFDTPTGKTRALHATDFGATRACQKTEWRWTLQLVSSSAFRMQQVGRLTLRIHLDASMHIGAAADAAESLINTTMQEDAAD